MTDSIDGKTEALAGLVMAKLAATQVLHSLLCEYTAFKSSKPDSTPGIFGRSFSKSEIDEYRDLYKRHLLRRIREEAAKAGFEVPK